MREIRNKFILLIQKHLSSHSILTTKKLRPYYKLMNNHRNKLILYKYCNCDYYTLRNIEKHTLALKKYTEFNDPFEGISITNSPFDKQELDKIRNCALLTCFSERKNDLLMFAHYANSYKGICIKYDLNLLNDEQYYKINEFLFPVIYTSKPIEVNYKIKLNQYVEKYKKSKKDKTVVLEKNDDILLYFIHKAINWKYEKEWRLVIPIDKWNETLDIDPNEATAIGILKDFDCISAIYLGANIDNYIKQHIIEIVNRLNESNKRKQKIKIYQTSLSNCEYKLVTEAVDL